MMQQAIKKSEVLIEALPYIKAFQESTIVVKYGGSAIVDRRKRRMILQDLIFMSYAGMYPVIVHGGGPYINKGLAKRGIKPAFVNGLRVTGEETIGIIKNILTRVNSQIVREIRMLGGKAQGITPRSSVIKVKKNNRFGDIGFVGEITSIDRDKIEALCKKGIIPVIAPLGIGKKKETYNINADEVSAGVATSLKAEKLFLLTNVDGILRDKKDKDSLISSLTSKQMKRLIANKRIDAGMIPKVGACITALKKGVNKIHVVNGSLTHALLLEIFTDKGIGTQIVKR